jgi:hypothetical protein
MNSDRYSEANKKKISNRPLFPVYKTSISEPQPKDHIILPNENQSNKFNLFGAISKSLKFSPQIIAEEQKSGKTIQRIIGTSFLLKNFVNISLFATINPIKIPIMNEIKDCSGRKL